MELGPENSTVATWLRDSGYATFYAGKFLNAYENTTHVPSGWDEWYAFAPPPELAAPQDYYTVNENGTLKTYTQDQQHETYYLRDKAEAFIRSHAQDDAQGGAPWFAWVSTQAPHWPHTVAPEFTNSYDTTKMPKPPSYNEVDVSDKPAWIQALPRLDSDCSQDDRIDCNREAVQEWRARQEDLMSVDVMVEDLIDALAETGQMERTYVVFTSDHGFLLYRHRVYGKWSPYEESQGVPFVVRGPGVGQGVVSNNLVANIDLAPTIAEWAGVGSPDYVDGRSLVPLLTGTQTAWRQRLLFEFWGGHGYSGVRTARGETYVEYESDEKEYYDLAKDPRQLDSAHAAPENAGRLSRLSASLSKLERCAGAGCRAVDGGP
jgi:arylsulfatase A-like enzyme